MKTVMVQIFAGFINFILQGVYILKNFGDLESICILVLWSIKLKWAGVWVRPRERFSDQVPGPPPSYKFCT